LNASVVPMSGFGFPLRIARPMPERATTTRVAATSVLSISTQLTEQTQIGMSVQRNAPRSARAYSVRCRVTISNASSIESVR